jgi:hypothetical protein
MKSGDERQRRETEIEIERGGAVSVSFLCLTERVGHDIY